MGKLLFPVFLIVCIVICACDIEPTSEPVSSIELIGVYYPSYNAGLAESIEIRTDSSYIHYYQSKEGVVYIDTGYWKLVYEGGEKTRPRVLFENFINRYPLNLNRYDQYGRLDTMPRGWGPYILKTKDKITIKRDPNTYQYYTKQ